MLSSFGRWCYDHRRLVVGLWLIALAIGGTLGPQVFSRLSTSAFASHSFESIEGYDVLREASPVGRGVAVLLDGVRVEDPTLARAATAAQERAARVPGVARVSSPWTTSEPTLRAKDGRAALVVLDLRREADRATSDTAVVGIRAAFDPLEQAVPGLSVRYGGDLLVGQEANDQVEKDIRVGEAIALPVALVVLVLAFAGFLAAVVPIAGALVSIAGGLLALLAFSHATDLDSNVLPVTTGLSVALAIDYSLLLVSRFREERAHGLEVRDAVAITSATAGRTIVFSGLTVATSLCGLFVFASGFYRTIGLAGLSVVLIAMLSALTLSPALLGLLGSRVRPGRAAPDDGRFARLARRGQRHKVLVVVGIGAGLLAVGSPALGVQLGLGGADQLPRSFESRQVADVVAARFPGGDASPVTVVARMPAAALGASVSGLTGRAIVGEPQQLGGGVSRVDLLAVGGEAGARDLVEELRTHRPQAQTWVTGDAAVLIDLRHEVVTRAPWALLVVALATFVLLFLMTGSVLVPVKALVMNALTLFATFGVLVLVFQHGWFSGLLGFEPTGSVETWLPVLVFAFGFGLAMDYEVFLLSRIKELVDEGRSNDDAVAVGLQRSGRIITSAALIVVIVFVGFVFGELVGIKQMGVALAFAVAVDATAVRMLLVPATMSLLGDANWWAPAPLKRLHARFGLSEAPTSTHPDLEKTR